MKKQLFFIIFLIINLSLSAARIANEPQFRNGFIQLATRGGLCGGLTLVPHPNFRVRVMSQLFSEKLFKSMIRPGKQLSDWIELPRGGMRVGYDWAGPRASYNYRIYCEIMSRTGSSWQPVDCAQAVTIEDVQHNRPCIMGPLGPSASYKPLNMKTRVKKMIKN